MTQNMTKGNPFKLLLLFSVPVFLGNLFQQLYNLVDSIVVGRYDGVVAFAAIGATSYLVFMVMGWLNGLTNGFSILIAQSFGAKDMKRLRHYVAMSYYLSIGMTLVLTVILLIFNKNILLMLNTPDNIIDQAKDYLTIIYAGLLATVMYNLLA
ncbi:MAG TPA: MATE family efflux transporter, partial [Candidatus Merdenecus merdavium]|nr:MATE family efflux transporter [Candidatus Merdenecus merdavium]